MLSRSLSPFLSVFHFPEFDWVSMEEEEEEEEDGIVDGWMMT